MPKPKTHEQLIDRYLATTDLVEIVCRRKKLIDSGAHVVKKLSKASNEETEEMFRVYCKYGSVTKVAAEFELGVTGVLRRFRKAGYIVRRYGLRDNLP